MDHRIGVAEIFAERRVERTAEDLLTGDAIHHDQRININRPRPSGVANAEIVHGVKSVRTDLDACADLAELVGLFENRNAASLFGQSERGGQTANAATNDYRGRAAIPCT